MSFLSNPGRIFLRVIPLSVLLFACTSMTIKNGEYISALQWVQEDDTPKIVVIMPFDNETSEKDIEILVRRSFYNHFSSKNFRDFELSEVDRVLEKIQLYSSQPWRDLSISSLGNYFHADYFIYGRVKEFKKIFLGIYSQIMLKVELEMVEGKSGDVVWGKAVARRSHDGGLPFSLFDVVPAALRSGIHMKKDKTIELVDRVNRELTEQIPEPPNPPIIPFFVEIQVASFLENRLAQKTLKEFEGKGLSPRIEKVTLGDRLWHRIILGPYHNLPEANKIRERIAQDSQFQPIFIHHYPKREDRDQVKK